MSSYYESDDESNDIKTLAFLDLETTGLDKNKRVTELSIIAVTVDNFLASRELPRVQNKITVCFDPDRKISYGARQITGLNNNMLADQNYFNDNAMSLLRSFLQHLMGPICFIAHNGRCFDFPLLKKELSTSSGSLPSEVGCCDSIPVFKTLTGYNYASYKLNEIHNEIFNSYPESSHCAEADAITLLKCALSFGEDFVEAVNRIRVSFT